MISSLKRFIRIKVLRQKIDQSDQEVFANLKKGDIAIDCGANVGHVSEQMLACGARVYAFEPNPYAFEDLQKRFAGNKNITCINKGVWDRNTRMKLFLHEHSEEDQVKWSTGSSLIESKGNVNPNDYREIEVIDLAEFIDQFPVVQLLKIDIEGAECELLEKFLDQRLYEKVNLTLVETHDAKIPELREPMDRIRERIRRENIRNIDLNWI